MSRFDNLGRALYDASLLSHGTAVRCLSCKCRQWWVCGLCLWCRTLRGGRP